MSIAENRRARFDYHIGETFEAGLSLTGSEVKTLRGGGAAIGEAYVSNESGELFLINAHIAPYAQARNGGHEPRRPRKLLLRKREIARIAGEIQRGGMTCVPLSLYFNKRGLAKLKIALAKGKKTHDKRETQKERDWNRQKSRIMREFA